MGREGVQVCVHCVRVCGVNVCGECVCVCVCMCGPVRVYACA